jgi:hypothetical protein
VEEENILTLKLKLTLFFLGCGGRKYPHTQTQTHSVFFGCEGRKYPHPQTQTHTVFCGFEYERFTLAFSSHSNSNSRCFFLGVEEENILTLKLTLFFLGVKEENIFTLTPKLTLFFLPSTHSLPT